MPATETVVVRGMAETRNAPIGAALLQSGRPQSVLTAQAIQLLATPVSDFGTLSNLLPSFVSSAPNGNGFDAAKGMSLRGFPDGQFNITLDGIPFADPDGFGHHSTSIVPATSISQVLTDRSPGSGSTLGYSTIGGTVNITSLALEDRAINAGYAGYGSFSTRLIGARLGSSRPQADGQAGWLVNAQHMQTAGAMSHADGRRDDLLIKAEARFGTLQFTAMFTYDDYHFKNPPSVSTSQIAQFGPDFGFTETPGSPTYNSYAQTDRSADFGYLRFQGEVGNWAGSPIAFNETVYTFAYRNRGLSLKGDLTASPVGNGFGVPATDIAGRLSENRYRTVGNIAQLEHTQGSLVLRGGLWLEHSRQKNQRNALDFSSGLPYNINKAANSPTLFEYDSTLDTVQPFLEGAWQLTPALSLRSGLRYQSVRRSFDAAVVPNALPGTGGKVTRQVNVSLPSVEGNLELTPQTHAYAQWAKGALTPNQSFFYTANPSLGNQAQPQTAQALQAGVMHAQGMVNLSAHAYLIDLKNYVSTIASGGNTQYVNNGRVRYQGIETEGNVQWGSGFSSFANASLMRARYRDSGITSAAQQAGDSIPLVPRYTGVLGLLYHSGPYSGSLTGKFVGTEFQGKNGSADGANFRVDAYHYSSLTIARSLDDWLGLEHASISLQVTNLENRRSITDTAGPSASGPLLVNVLAGRSFMLTLRAEL